MLHQNYTNFPGRVAQKILRIFGFELKRIRQSKVQNNGPLSTKPHQAVTPYATYSPWIGDADFQAIFNQIKSHTLVDIYRCYELWTLAKQTIDVEGDILEVGVWRGGTGAILAQATKTIPGKKVFLADTFTGVVKAGTKDTRYQGGEHADTSLAIVEELLTNLSLSNTQILQGIFPEESHLRIPGKIAMLHCDVDVYQSSKDIVEWCLPRLSRGSILVFDDFGFAGCEGVTTYCEEFREVKGFRFFHNLNGHAVFIKVAD
jgi:O-methyltransferase